MKVDDHFKSKKNIYKQSKIDEKKIDYKMKSLYSCLMEKQNLFSQRIILWKKSLRVDGSHSFCWFLSNKSNL